MRSSLARSLSVSAFIVAAVSGCSGGSSPAGTAGAGGGGAGAGAGGSTNTGGSTATGGNTAAAGSGGVATYTPPPVPAGGMEACVAFAKATCAKRDACTTGMVKGTTIIYGGASQCEARELPKCLATLTARGTNKTPALLSACTSSLPQQSCPDYFDNILTAPCRPIAGTLANGAPCLSSWQCTSTFCSLPHADVCGACAPRPKAGDPCADNVCGTGLLCHTSTLLCETAVADGGACDKNNPCMSGAACVGNGATAKGMCKAEGQTAGAPCDPKSATLPGCDKNAGLFCDATSMQCKAMASATDGQPCGKVAGVDTVCVGGALCAGASAIQPGTCKAPVAEGAACNDVTGPPCLSPAKCVKSICKLPDAAVCF